MYQDFGFYPYQNYQPFSYGMAPQRRGGLAGLFHRGNSMRNLASVGGIRPKFDWGSFLSNTQKTLNVVNQAIPIFYQIKPIWSNAKTMFKIMGAINDDDTLERKTSGFQPNEERDKTTLTNQVSQENQPQFFL